MTGLPQLNRKLVLEDAVRVADGAGGYTPDWQPLGTLWAEVTPRLGRAGERGGIGVAEVEMNIVVRAAPVGVSSRPKPGQRLREGDRLFRFDSVTERDTSGRFLTCRAQEVQA